MQKRLLAIVCLAMEACLCVIGLVHGRGVRHRLYAQGEEDVDTEEPFSIPRLLADNSRTTALQNRSIVAPTKELVKSIVNEAYTKFKTDNFGKNADCIPYLAKVDSNLFGIAVVTTEN
jgi:hypothetical protein